MKSTAFLLSLCFVPGVMFAQEDDAIPLLTPAEKKAVEQQQAEFANAFTPTLDAAAKSTVRIWYKARGGDRRAAYGTVIGDGTKVLTKWSQVVSAVDDFRVESGDRQVRAVTVTGVYPDEDLAVLTLEGAPLTPVKWSETPATLGHFLVASQPDGKAASYGVVSVLERNLRKTDQAFLGVEAEVGHTGPGVQIKAVTKDSPASTAGLKKGDVILKVGERNISGLTELQSSLWGAKPGTKIDLIVRQNDRDQKVEVQLASRPELQQFTPDRLLQMERMGSRLSRVRDGFSHAIETDMVLEPEQIGGPVADLKGEVIGITMARAGRTRSYVMPAAAVEELLKTQTTDPSLATVKDTDQATAAQPREVPQGQGQQRPRGKRIDPDELEKMKRHGGDMEKLMQRIQSEIEALERGE
jgi:S1-C subfamily serine protease